MPKGRNKPTPMVMFMNEMRQEMENEHKKKFKLPFDEALYVLCKPLYDQLSEDEKQYYKDMAKSEWTGIKLDKNKKLTSQGIPVAVIERQQLESEKKKRIEFMEIEKAFNFDINIIMPMEIVVIHVNWFCKINEDSFVPAEVALARFSLKDGFIDSYHCFPVYEFPPGTKGDSKIHSDRTHQIPLYDFSEKLEKWPNVYRDISKFLSKNKHRSLDGASFPLYTMNDDVNDITSRNAIRSFLNLIVSAANVYDTDCEDPHEKYFKLYDLSKLLRELKHKDPSTPPHHAQLLDEQVFEAILRKDMYLQSTKIACQWHDERDLIPKCSRSRCLSWIYIICDQCKFMGYPMIPGKHMPFNATLNDYTRWQSSSPYNGDDDEEVLSESERQFDGSSEYGYDCDDTGSVASSYQYSERGLPSRMKHLSLGKK
ncbi:protein maelstrom homolog [Diaphorina citri]|uniref:Protein maelstrom homolog n=1 Tax=Diaphorina citri TaxID=121845 RepID=A0A1S3D5H8_DIACI|nr:protein maelstrom homolog [Diaphorina citri]